MSDHSTQQTSLEPDEPELIPAGPPAHCTVIAVDGRVLRMMPPAADGSVLLHISGRGTPLRLDRYQIGALRAAVIALQDGGA